MNVLFYLSALCVSFIVSAAAVTTPHLKPLAVALPENSKQLCQAALKRCNFTLPIRVLLDEKPVASDFSWQLTSPHGFIILDPQDAKKKLFYPQKQITIISKSGNISINGKKLLHEQLYIVPCKERISFGPYTYDGALTVHKYQSTVYLVNHLDLEDYVLSVVPYESWPGWPAEVNKALCVSFRTYGIAKVLEQRAVRAKKKINLPYDIKNGPIHQVYKGHYTGSKYDFKSIVDATRGIVLAYNNKPITAMFDICCGGVIPANKVGMNFKEAPYLARTYPCTFCEKYKFYAWKYVYTAKELEKLLKPEFPTLVISDVKVTRKDTIGTAQEMALREKSRWIAITGKKLKSLVKNLKSLCFSVTRSRLGYVFEGKGHGHQWGLCQWGACGMVNKGHNYKQVLQFYYPHTTFMKLVKAPRS
ncbi:SpoIID/LytB domain-containing protein [Candidatus Dependentiae bacterium]|nr:SpoIID/LytB domain-containing protein [Candidatus Dependentiae bacterium]